MEKQINRSGQNRPAAVKEVEEIINKEETELGLPIKSSLSTLQFTIF